MFCPSCGTESNDQTKYCTKCGVNLRRVKGVMSKGGASVREGVDWERASFDEWRAGNEAKRKKNPEEKRFNEIKSGVITSCVGLGLWIFLSMLFDAIAATAPDHVGAILRAIPFVGLIPLLIGLGIIFNGLFISKRIVALKRQEELPERQSAFLPVANTTPVAQLVESAQAPVTEFSIAEPTTRTLREPIPLSSSRDTN